ncbi:sporulation protein YqfD [Clostridiaceae bacterium M8S5]|nr:sporulation protein YqfD [Clostridiaceae bacterium M8S5]
MLIIRLWNYFRGYVIIKIEGLMLERFINNSIDDNIYLWDIDRVDYTTLVAKVGVKGFNRLIQKLGSNSFKVSIIKEKGFPFFISKLKHRKMMAVGSLISLIIIFYLTSFIWVIEVVGEDKIVNDKVISHLKQYNIRPGIRKANIDIKQIRDKLIIDIDDISYTRAEVVGTKLVIEVKKRDVKNEVDNKSPCNIVANKNAIIYKIIAKNGKALVEKGDVVKAGQILITGQIEDERLEKPLLVHANGEVLGKTSYTKYIKEPISKEIKEETGKTYTVKELKIGSKSISVSNGKIPFDCYIEKTKSNKLIDNALMSLPIEIITHKYCEVVLKNIKQDVEALKEVLRVRGIQNLMSNIPKNSKVVSQNVSYKIDEQYITAILHIEVMENITLKKIIK